ncbi:hypothetical protein EGU54_01600 [Achromobacter aegrifaciens]|nr:hypothetical protein EGU54_01600 [Achromobacter aegrifaciens]
MRVLEGRVQIRTLLRGQCGMDRDGLAAYGGAGSAGQHAQTRGLGSGFGGLGGVVLRGLRRRGAGLGARTHDARAAPGGGDQRQRQREQIKADVHARRQRARLLPPDDDGEPDHAEDEGQQQPGFEYAAHGCDMTLSELIIARLRHCAA